jgi:endonuclease/exonuclease/phosphatase family metal-dependent hydrolase
MDAPHHLFVAALAGTPGATWSAATGEEQPDSAAYGVALLSRYPVLGWRVVRLPAAPVPVPHRFHDQRLPVWVRDEPRVAVVADVETPTGRLQVVNTHLSFLRRWNTVQLRRLVRALGPRQCPVVLMGDLNMGPEQAARGTGLRPLASGLTFPAHDPTEQIDHLLADEGVGPAAGAVLDLPMSDHRALVADLPDGVV